MRMPRLSFLKGRWSGSRRMSRIIGIALSLVWIMLDCRANGSTQDISLLGML
jgi:hypothetical protein